MAFSGSCTKRAEHQRRHDHWARCQIQSSQYEISRFTWPISPRHRKTNNSPGRQTCRRMRKKRRTPHESVGLSCFGTSPTMNCSLVQTTLIRTIGWPDAHGTKSNAFSMFFSPPSRSYRKRPFQAFFLLSKRPRIPCVQASGSSDNMVPQAVPMSARPSAPSPTPMRCWISPMRGDRPPRLKA